MGQSTAEIIPARGLVQVQYRLEVIERQLPMGLPLARLNVVMHVLGVDEDRAKHLYESGLLQYAFDLSSTGSKRSEMRVYRDSIVAYSQNNISHLLPKSQEETAKALSAVIRACLPPGNGPILLSKLRRLWSVSATHLHNLCTAGQITVIPNPQLKATESPLLSRESVTAFLRARRFL